MVVVIVVILVVGAVIIARLTLVSSDVGVGFLVTPKIEA